MRAFASFLIFILPILTHSATAEKDCTPVDLRTDVLGPAQDQQDIGWCYAFTASDLLTHKLGKRISPVEMAVTYNNTVWHRKLATAVKSKKNKNDIDHFLVDGGRAADALKNAMEVGVCTSEKVNFENFMSMRWGIAFIDTFNKNSPKLFGTAEQSCEDKVKVIQDVFPTIDEGNAVSEMEKKSKRALFDRLVQDACPASERIFPKNFEVKNVVLKDKAMKALDEQLNAKNIAAIAYNGMSVLNDEFRVRKSARHASVVVGRRFNSEKKSCEYLVRNSYGESCEFFSKSLECEKGNIWMQVDDLKKSLYSVTYLKDR